MIIEAFVLFVSGALVVAGVWILWSATGEAWHDWWTDR